MVPITVTLISEERASNIAVIKINVKVTLLNLPVIFCYDYPMFKVTLQRNQHYCPAFTM